MSSIRRDDGWHVLVDGCGYGPFDAVEYQAADLYWGSWRPCFSPDSKQAFFAACKQGRWLLFVEGVWFNFTRGELGEGGEELVPIEEDGGGPGRENSIEWTQSVDGSRWVSAYTFYDQRCLLIVDGIQLPQEFDWLRLDPCKIPSELSVANNGFFSASGRHYACPVRIGDDSFLLSDGKLNPCVSKDLEARKVFWAPDGERYNYLAMHRKRSYGRKENGRTVGDVCMVLDGKAGPDFVEIGGSLYYSPDGRHTAYVGSAMTGEQVAHDHMVMDGLPIKRRSYINHHDSMGFTADNKLYFVSASAADPAQSSDGDYFFHFGEAVSEALDSIHDCMVSPDGRHVAVCGERNRKIRQQRDILILDGKPCPILATGWSHHGFSPDSRHHLWEVERNGYVWLLLDGRILFGRSKCVWGPRFTPDSRYIEYVCQQGRALRYRRVAVAKLLKRRK